jgi:hypothetical protein
MRASRSRERRAPLRSRETLVEGAKDMLGVSDELGEVVSRGDEGEKGEREVGRSEMRESGRLEGGRGRGGCLAVWRLLCWSA